MKKIDFKSIIVGLVAGVIIASGVGVASTLVTGEVYFSSFPIYVNGSYYTASSPLLNYNGRTYVPLNELGTMLGANVNFANNTIYLNSNNNYYDDYNNYYDSTQTYEEDLEIELDESEKYYVSLARYGARSATVTTTNSCVKVNKTKFTSSGDLEITGRDEGDSIVRITYNTGDVEKLYVEVYEDEDEHEEDIVLETGDTKKIYVDLDYYDADSATISYDSDYIKVSKTKFTNDGYLTITAKDEGDTTVKVKYDTGDIEYYYIEIDDDYKYEEDISMGIDDTKRIYVDLDDYDADYATISYDSDYIDVSKTKFTSNGYLTITAEDEGDTTLKVKYDTGDVEYYYIEIDDDDYYLDDNYDEIEVEEDDYEYVYIDLDDYDATSATLTYNSSYIKLNKTTLTESGKVKVTGRNEGYTSIKVKFNTGEIVYIDVEVTV